MERLKQELLACLGEEGLKLHEMMKEHTTFRVGGAADYFIQPKSAEELRAAFEILPWQRESLCAVKWMWTTL